jgi:Tellurite resistance protein TerB
MNNTDLTPEQKQALMDLLVLGMYADRNLASAEDACVQKLLASLQFASDSERDRFADAAFTRTSRHTGSSQEIQAYVNALAPRFTSAELRQSVYDRLNELLTSDGRVTTEESQLLAAVKTAFRL